MAYCVDPIVSQDIVGDPHSCIFDSLLTMSTGTMVKVSDGTTMSLATPQEWLIFLRSTQTLFEQRFHSFS